MQNVQNSVQQIDRTTVNLSRTLTSMAGTFAAAFSAKEAIALADTFTRFEAKLINANVAAKDMAATQEKLFEIAKANGSEIVSVAELYGSLTTATSDLKTSQADLITITEGVAAALKVSGAGAAQASSVILQLSQAIASGKLTAQEYNSIIDASPALFQGLAKEIPGVNGSLGKLRQAMLDGKLTVDVLIPALTRMSDEMVNKAAKAPLTVEASLQNLRTSLVQFVGQADQSLGATEKLSFAIKLLGENLDTVAGAIAVVGAVMLGRYAGAMIASTAETIRYQVALASMAARQAVATVGFSGMSRGALLATTAMRGLSGAMAFFGGPIGLAITAIALAIYGVSSRMAELKRRTQELPAAFGETESKIQEYKQAQLDAASATAEAAKASRDRAAALREETFALINKRRVETQDAIDRATKADRSADRYERAAASRRAGSNDRSYSNASTSLDVGANQQAKGARALADQLRAEADLQIRGLRDLENKFAAPPTQTAVTPTPTPNTKAGGGGGGGGGGGPKHSADDIRQASEDLEREQVRRLTDAMADLADTTEARHQNALKHLEWERDDAILAVDRQRADGAITQAAADTAKADIERTFQAKQQLEIRTRQRELEEKRIDALREQAAFEDNIARILDATARNRAEQADTLAERLAIERQAFDAYQIAEKASMDARHEEARARERLTGAIDAEAERRRQSEAAAFAGYQKSEKDGFDRDQRSKNPFAKHVDAAKDWQTNVMTSMSDGLETLGDDLTDVILRTKELGDMFRNVSKQIVADLLRIAVQKAVVAPLANMLGFGDGGSFLNFFGGGKSPARKAIGTNFSQGGPTWVGEAGAELVNLPKGTQVMPNSDVRKLRQQNQGMSRSAPVFNFQTTVHANDSVVYGQIRDDIAAANYTAVQNARQLVAQDMMDQQRGAVRR